MRFSWFLKLWKDGWEFTVGVEDDIVGFVRVRGFAGVRVGGFDIFRCLKFGKGSL